MTIAGSPPQPLEIEIGEGSRLLIVAGEWPLEPIPGAPPGSVRARARPFRRPTGPRAFHRRLRRARHRARERRPNAGACFINGLLIEGS